MRILGKIVYGTFIALLVTVAGLLLVSLLPLTGNVEIKIVKSGSMEPAISTGSLVVVKPAANYYTGEIITFGKDTARDIPTTHRIVSMRKEGGQTYYQTKGDANEEQDPREIAASEVLGKVVFSVPYAGYILDFARQPMGFALLIGVPAAMIVIDESINIFREVMALRNRRRRKNAAEIHYMPVPQKPSAVSGLRAGPRYYAQERTRIPTI